MKFKFKKLIVYLTLLIISWLILKYLYSHAFSSLSGGGVVYNYLIKYCSFSSNNSSINYTNTNNLVNVVLDKQGKENNLNYNNYDNKISIEETTSFPNQRFEVTTKGNFSFITIKQALDATQLQSSFNICLATQTTIDRVSTITKLATYWAGGPIELVLFLRESLEINIVQAFMKYLASCYFSSYSEYDVDDVQWFIRTVSVQLAFKTDDFSDEDLEMLKEIQNIAWKLPNNNNNNNNNNANNNYEDDSTLVLDELCYDLNNTLAWSPEDYLKALMNEYLPDGPDPEFVYPQSHMRNAAKYACRKHYDWITVLDVDIIPKMGSAVELQKFYNSNEAQNCQKCAFVLPVYELEKPCHYPKTKIELLTMANSSLAIPFHFTFWKPAHRATNYNKWNRTHLNEGPITISHPTDYKLSISSLKNAKRHKIYFYEPFYISHSSIPDYEERFLGFGFTRSTQAFSALIDGWSFKVLSPVFITHCGIQQSVKKDSFKTIPRYQQVQANNKIYKVFIDEKLKEYQEKKKKQKS